ncbi:hypothetical protein [Pseudomonas libanensis]|uniref:Uncharacterized protein n=1 Tax=Pseudomonas libanensis TaxID=75588 RepID=A0ABR5MDA8_9PSED|nr:hypothetical protein [Pseudomonas libanensis]KPG77333.1 hypothetical protein AEQ48_03070 [Pseudomonas libanensis]
MSMDENPLSQAEAKQWLKPFGSLSINFDEQFKLLVSDLISLIREHGINKLHPDLTKGPEEYLKFVGFVHEGWKIAQRLIIEKLIEGIEEIKRLEIEKKSAHQSKNRALKDEIIDHIESIGLQNFLLRRFIDAIAWSMLKCEHSTIRRLSNKGATDNMSIATLKEGLEYADSVNKDPLMMALVTDATTFIHTCDIITVNPIKATQFIELKSGDKNFEMSKAAQFAVKSKCEKFSELYTSDLSDKDKKHFERSKRQLDRADTIIGVINTGKGKDHNTGATVTISEIESAPESYAKTMSELYKKLNDNRKGVIGTIDECLHVGIYTDRKLAITHFNSWMRANNCTSKIYNILDFIKNPHCRPLPILNLSTKFLNEIASDKTIVVMCLNIQKLIEKSNELYPDFLYLETKEESKRALEGYYQFLSLNGLALGYNLGEAKGFIGKGLADRVIFDFIKPLSAIKMQYETMNSAIEKIMSANT